MLYRTLFKGLAWNTFESIAYQGILILHLIALYRHTDPSFFGMMGIIFSLLYLMTFLANAGFDTALAPYAQLLTTDRRFWHTIVIPHLRIQCIVYVFIGICGIIVNPPSLIRAISSASYGGHAITPYSLSIILALLLVTESTKKTLRTIAHLTFHNQLTALVEVSMVSIYVALVWLSYAYYTALSLTLILFPLFITSLISCLILGCCLYDFYQHLPTESTELIPTHRTFISTRLYTYGAHLGHILFSSNFLIPFCALHIGLAHTGIFKLISSITHTITTMVYKIFGPTSQALFSHTSTNTYHDKQQLFFTLTQYLHHVLYGLIIFFVINYAKLIGTHLNTNNFSTPLIILFLVIQLTEHMFIVYEKFFIAHHRAAYLCILSLVSLTITGTLLLLPLPASPVMIMSLVLGIRMITISTLAITAYHWFHIKPALTLRADYLAVPLILAGIFFLCF
ncbi:MAG: hypothetical protein ACHQVS_01705 [Candidatus Babeliales bacterium]